MVQQLRLHTSPAVGTGSISGRGTKIPHATWCGQKKKILPNLDNLTYRAERRVLLKCCKLKLTPNLVIRWILVIVLDVSESARVMVSKLFANQNIESTYCMIPFI